MRFPTNHLVQAELANVTYRQTARNTSLSSQIVNRAAKSNNGSEEFSNSTSIGAAVRMLICRWWPAFQESPWHQHIEHEMMSESSMPYGYISYVKWGYHVSVLQGQGAAATSNSDCKCTWGDRGEACVCVCMHFEVIAWLQRWEYSICEWPMDTCRYTMRMNGLGCWWIAPSVSDSQSWACFIPPLTWDYTIVDATCCSSFLALRLPSFLLHPQTQIS